MGLVLAAGASSRLGRSKMLEPVLGRPLVRRSCAAATAVCGAGVTVVTGRQTKDVGAAVRGLATSVVENPSWSEGMASSIRAGIDSLARDVTAVLVMPGDLAEVNSDDLTRLVSAWCQRPDVPAAALFDDVVGAPAIFPRTWFPRLVGLSGDHGARNLLRAAESISKVSMDSASLDVDSQSDLDRLSGELD